MIGPFESMLESFFGFFFLAKNYSCYLLAFPIIFASHSIYRFFIQFSRSWWLGFLCLEPRLPTSSFDDVNPRFGSGTMPLVGSNGLEPSTSRLSGVRSNHLSYEPISVAGRVHRPTLLLRLIPFGFIPLVETNRIELSTPCLQGRCSPS